MSRAAPRRLVLLTLLVAAAFGRAAAAQTPIVGLGAMQPSTGHFTGNLRTAYRQFDGDASTEERDVHQASIVASITYALLSNVAVTLDVPVIFNHLSGSALAPSDDEVGVGDMVLAAKWRIWQHDSSPTDTMRAALLGGIQLPGGTTTYWDSTEDGFNPLLGAVFSIVRGRHGGNVSALWEFSTEGDSEPSGGLRVDGSYVFRLAPETFGDATSGAAWYLVAELNALYETNGNSQLFLGPGVMYEASWFTLEFGVTIPLTQDLKDRPDLEFGIGAGLRVAF